MSANSFFGRSGHDYVLSLFLGRGYNVAIPVVDVGDDAIVIDDGEHTLRRLQVKHGVGKERKGARCTARFTLKRSQLRDPGGAPLYYFLLARVWGRWRFILLSREVLRGRVEQAIAALRVKSDEDASSDDIILEVTFGVGEEAWLWGDSLAEYLDRWVDCPALPKGRSGQ